MDRRRSRRVANQAFLYVGAYYLTFLFGTVSRSMQLAGKAVPEAIFICFVVFYPLQGTFNALIYMMPRYVKWRQKNPTAPASQFLLGRQPMSSKQNTNSSDGPSMSLQDRDRVPTASLSESNRTHQYARTITLSDNGSMTVTNAYVNSNENHPQGSSSESNSRGSPSSEEEEDGRRNQEAEQPLGVIILNELARITEI